MSNNALLKNPSGEIMVVDDDLSSLRMMNNILSEHGYQVRPAGDGRLALRSIEKVAPDLILLDIKMPGMDGYEVCRRLQADEKSRKIPVIFISALEETAEKIQGFKAGAVDFITKPYEAQEVLARVRTHLRLRELTEHLEEEVKFFENLELVDRAIRQSNNAEQMPRKVIQTVVSIFDCDRAWLLYPCDPEAPTFRVPVEVCRPEYPGVYKFKNEMPMKPGAAQVCADALRADGPLVYGPQAEHQVYKELTDQFGVLSQMTLALSPKVGKPWLFGMHQCSRPRIWTDEEQKLFNEIGRRLVDGLSTMQSIKNFRESEAELKRHRDKLEEGIKERTAELAEAKESAEAANQAKSSFLANMSHELRTPLSVIMGYSQLMQKEVLSPTEQQEYLDTINRNGEHLLALINEVLEISKIEAGQLTVERATFDLTALFRDLERLFDSSVDAKGLFFEVIGIDDVPRYVTTDEHKLRQVMVNIVGNAVKFTEQGGITVRVAAKDETADAMRLVVEVQDTGVGIAEDEMDQVFAYLEQTASGRAKKSGTGLGLAISRNYVRKMGGDITVTSKEGKGSTFRFEIDIKKGDKADIKARGSRHRVMGLQPSQKVPRVLVAEDERDSRNLLVKFLKTAGFEVEEAVDGKEAVEKFNQWRPDFIWIDIRMPVMDGLEAVRRIKKTEAGQSTIVAAITAHALEEEKERILAAGCDDFVPKPFREQQVFEVMAKHLGLKYVYEEEPVAPDAGVETETQVSPVQLASLPSDLRFRLHQAVVEANEVKCLKIVEQIEAHDANMAGKLQTIVNQLEFHRLVKLLQGGQAKPGGSQ
jgi:signal transduction histidine kinase/DNA-binding response OmpR family regulator